MKKISIICMVVLIGFTSISYSEKIKRDNDFFDNPINFLNLLEDPEMSPIFSLFFLTQIKFIGIYKYTNDQDENNTAYAMYYDHIKTKQLVDIIMVFDLLDGKEFYGIADGKLRNIQFIYGKQNMKKVFVYFPNDVDHDFSGKIEILKLDYKKLIESLKLTGAKI